MPNKFNRHAICLATLLLALVTAGPAFAQPSDPVVSNVQVTVRGNYVDINYDLEQAEGLPCVILPRLSKDGGQKFEFSVTTMTGDWGKVIPGQGKKIVWNALKDYPDEHILEAGFRVDAFLQEKTILLPGSVPLVMLWIPGGDFTMGRYPGEQDSFSNEDPQHTVTVPGFWLAKYELTKRQWMAVMGTEPWAGQANVLNDLDSPAVYVSWDDAKAFIAALNTYTGMIFRLPSEAEWEYAARAGDTTRLYWGDDPSYTMINNYAWWQGNANNLGNRYAHVVGQKLPNAFGLYDISGNVWEWCEDDWHDSYNGAPTDGSAWVDTPRSTNRMGRGGSWIHQAYYCRSAYRDIIASSATVAELGFRLSAATLRVEEEETILLPGDVPLEMVRIPAGTFLMGRYPGEQDSFSNEDPQHSVTVPSFWMGKYELTKRQWKAVMGTEPWAGQDYVLNDLDSPAVWVSWDNAKAFITALNNHTGLTFRLPSESEWEHAVRADTTTRFYWGDDPDYTQINEYAWWGGNANSLGNSYAHVVGQKLPNAFGLYDICGNVWEWCEDDWHINYNGAPLDGSAWVDSPRGLYRVTRGGAWLESGSFCRSTARTNPYSSSPSRAVGFRLVR